MRITIHNTQLLIIKEQLIAKVELKEFPKWLGQIEMNIRTDSKNVLASMISTLKDTKRYDIDNQKIKIKIWNDFLTDINEKYRTNFTCFAEEVKEITKYSQDIKDGEVKELSLNEMLNTKE